MYSLFAYVDNSKEVIWIGEYPTELGARRVANRRVVVGEYRRIDVYAPDTFLFLHDPIYVRERVTQN